MVPRTESHILPTPKIAVKRSNYHDSQSSMSSGQKKRQAIQTQIEGSNFQSITLGLSKKLKSKGTINKLTELLNDN
jgi:hypothetical protein